jgi:anti-sigma B factor antagonist
MEATRFEARVRHRSGMPVIDLSGEVDGGADERLNEAYEIASSGGPETILLNFEDVAYINSTGIALIVGLLARTRKDGGRILSCGLSDHYREIFEITRLADFMQLYDDEESAVAEAPAAEERR